MFLASYMDIVHSHPFTISSGKLYFFGWSKLPAYTIQGSVIVFKSTSWNLSIFTNFAISLSVEMEQMLSNIGNCDTIQIRKVREQKAAYPPLRRGKPSRRKKGGQCRWLHMLIYFSFVFSLLPLLAFVIRSSREENSRQLLPIVDG